MVLCKGYVCLLLSIILIVPILCGCQNSYSPILEEDIPAVPQKFVFKTEFSQYPSDVKTIKYFKTNISGETISTGDGVYLCLFKDNKWQYVNGKREVEFQYTAFFLEPDDTIPFRFNLKEYYFPLEPGQYFLCDGDYRSEPFEIIE